MSLKEQDVVDRIRESLREAIDASQALAVASWRGIQYERLWSQLGLVEGACRQLAMFRQDYRWLVFGLKMHECRAAAGDRLRGYTKNGIHITWTIGHQNEWFVTLAAELTVILGVLDKLIAAKTGTTGPILPVPVDNGRPIGMRAFDNRSKRQKQAAKLILPGKHRHAG